MRWPYTEYVRENRGCLTPLRDAVDERIRRLRALARISPTHGRGGRHVAYRQGSAGSRTPVIERQGGLYACQRRAKQGRDSLQRVAASCRRGVLVEGNGLDASLGSRRVRWQRTVHGRRDTAVTPGRGEVQGRRGWIQVEDWDATVLLTLPRTVHDTTAAGLPMIDGTHHSSTRQLQHFRDSRFSTRFSSRFTLRSSRVILSGPVYPSNCVAGRGTVKPRL